MNKRIIGFDLARAYAIFGMYIVNFTFCFGSFADKSTMGMFNNLFIGNSTSIFVICAGMGVILLTNKENASDTDKKRIKDIIIKRSWFLFAMGVALYSWWPGDILHFYGGYMHIAAFILFIPRRNYLLVAVLAVLVYYILQFFIPITTSWDLQTTRYLDFWTPVGFLRNTLYNGWNSIFPWFAYFAIGMYLAKIDWHDIRIQRKMFLTGSLMLLVFKSLRLFIRADFDNPERQAFYRKYWLHLMEDYFPVNIPYLMITIGWAFTVISICMYIGNRFSNSNMLHLLAKVGQMTLSFYVFHITVGMLLFGLLFDRSYSGFLTTETAIQPAYILAFAGIFFALSLFLAWLWSKKFQKGPLELLMRKISG
ncbi:MAG: DUF418 domain-containing protein [Saprospiraceae bacterium]